MATELAEKSKAPLPARDVVDPRGCLQRNALGLVANAASTDVSLIQPPKKPPESGPVAPVRVAMPYANRAMP
jgi:hypothetical protein